MRTFYVDLVNSLVKFGFASRQCQSARHNGILARLFKTLSVGEQQHYRIIKVNRILGHSIGTSLSVAQRIRYGDNRSSGLKRENLHAALPSFYCDAAGGGAIR
jgi:uncharacterized alpha/beta hydrolase family protein